MNTNTKVTIRRAERGKRQQSDMGLPGSGVDHATLADLPAYLDILDYEMTILYEAEKHVVTDICIIRGERDVEPGDSLIDEKSKREYDVLKVKPYPRHTELMLESI